MGHHRLRLLVVVALAGFVSAWLAYVRVYVPSGGRTIRCQTAAIGRLELPRARTEVFRDREEWLAFLSSLPVATTAPRIDFERDDAVLLALGPRSTTGFAVDVVRVEEERGRVLVVARETDVPGAQPLVSYPSVVVIVRATGKPIAVDWVDYSSRSSSSSANCSGET